MSPYRTFCKIIVVFLMFLLTNGDVGDNQPQITQGWIYVMIAGGFIGLIVHLTIIFVSIRHYRKKKQKSKLSLCQNILNYTIWICNLIACAEWCILRTSLFISLNRKRCVIIYVSNYLFYMMGKYTLHILLLYRLYFVFRKTNVRFNKHLLYLIFCIITINFLIFTGAWMDSAFTHVVVGVIVPSKSLFICTMFNNSDSETIHTADRIWPILLGGQDLVVGLFTLCLFVYKISQFQRDRGSFYATRFGRIMTIVRKLLVLGTISIISTFIFYTFAVPFYGNLTFLLPVDASINSVCTVLLFSYVGNTYNVLCYVCDGCSRIVFNAPTAIRKLSTPQSARDNESTNTKDLTLGSDDLYSDSQLNEKDVGVELHNVIKSNEQIKEEGEEEEKNGVSLPTFHCKSQSQSNVHYKQNEKGLKPLSLENSREVRSSFF